jgi:hypothetical protein
MELNCGKCSVVAVLFSTICFDEVLVASWTEFHKIYHFTLAFIGQQKEKTFSFSRVE